MIEPEYRMQGWPHRAPDTPQEVPAENPSDEPNSAPQEARIGRGLPLPLFSRLASWARGLLGR